MAEGIIARVAERLGQALDGLFDDPAPDTPVFPQNLPTEAPSPTITVSKSGSQSVTLNPEPRKLGKITSYNYKTEELPDTNSQNLKGAWNNRLTKQGLAVSPDIEEQFREAGIKPKDKVEITLADGTKLVRSWEDRTMQDKLAIKTFGKPLRGRFDLHVPDYQGPHEKDDIAVVGFQKVASAQ